jgi:hypothetical protein
MPEGPAPAGERAEKQGEHDRVARDAMSFLPSLWIRALTDGGEAYSAKTR